MRRTEARQGVRMIAFLSILGRYEAAEFSQLEAAELLGVGERTFRRWRQRFEDDGDAGLLDRRLGKASGKRVPADCGAQVEALYKTRYAGFTAKHFHAHLARHHAFAWGYTWTKTFLHSRGLLERAKRRGAHRRKRPRRPMPGMMLHQPFDELRRLAARLAGGAPPARSDRHDGRSDKRHSVGLSGRGGRHGVDVPGFGGGGWPARPATQPLYGSGQPLFSHARGWRKGRSDAPDAGRPGPRTSGRRTYRGLFARQARGRSERVFDTLQDRLTKELALAGIATVEAANVYLRGIYIPAHNARFAVAAEQEGAAFVAIPGVDLGEILCIQEDRQVGNDNCVSFNRLKLQIPASPLRAHFVKATVKVRHYPDGTHAIFHGPRCLGRYDQKGALEEARKVA